MKTSLLAVLALAASIAVGSAAALAYNYHHGIMSVTNNTRYQVWITTYNVFRHQINYGWIQPRQTVVYDNCCYLAGSTYYVRAEVKITEHGQMRQLADLDIRISPNLCANSSGPFGSGRAILEPGRLTGEYTGAYWREDSVHCP